MTPRYWIDGYWEDTLDDAIRRSASLPSNHDVWRVHDGHDPRNGATRVVTWRRT